MLLYLQLYVKMLQISIEALKRLSAPNEEVMSRNILYQMPLTVVMTTFTQIQTFKCKNISRMIFSQDIMQLKLLFSIFPSLLFLELFLFSMMNKKVKRLLIC